MGGIDELFLYLLRECRRVLRSPPLALETSRLHDPKHFQLDTGIAQGRKLSRKSAFGKHVSITTMTNCT